MFLRKLAIVVSQFLFVLSMLATVPAGAKPAKKDWWNATSWYLYGGTASEFEELLEESAPTRISGEVGVFAGGEVVIETEFAAGLVSTRDDFSPLTGIGGTYCLNDHFVIDFGLEYGSGTLEHDYEETLKHDRGEKKLMVPLHVHVETDAEVLRTHLVGRFYLSRWGRVHPWVAAGISRFTLQLDRTVFESVDPPEGFTATIKDVRIDPSDLADIETTEVQTSIGFDFELSDQVALSLAGDHRDDLGWSAGLSLRFKVSPNGCCRDDDDDELDGDELGGDEEDGDEQDDDKECGPFLPGEAPLPRIETPVRTVRRPRRLDASALPAGSRAHLGAFDGDPFFVSLKQPSAASVLLQDVVAPTLKALGFSAGPETLQASEVLRSRVQDLAVLAESVELELDADPDALGPTGPAIVEVLRGRAAPSAPVDAALKASVGLDYAELVADVTRRELLYPFQQMHDGVPIEHTLLLASGRPRRGVTSVRGALIDDYYVANQPTLTSPAAAANEAMREVQGVQRVDLPADGEGPILVLLPYGSDDQGRIRLRYAYRMILVARFCQQEVPFLLWLDAADATLLKLEPLVFDVAGKEKEKAGEESGKAPVVGARASAYDRDPGVGTRPTYIHVDPEQDGKYVLQTTGAMNRIDFQDDSFDDLDVAVTMGEEGALSFDQYPINDTSQALCGSGTNKQFQQVHFYASVMRYRRYSLALGVDAVFSLAWSPGVESPRAGCGAWSNMSFGACRGYSDPACPNYSDGTDSLENCMNFAHDSTVIGHEFGHNITNELTNRRPFDWCGKAECSIPVGWAALHDLADFWSDHLESSNCVGGWVCKNVRGVDASLGCLTHSEGEGMPRLHELTLPFDPAAPGDHFPEHRRLANGEYTDMQIGAAALWQLRLAARSRSPAAGIPFAARLSRALYKTGFLSETPPDTDRGVYQYLYNLETELAEQWASAAKGNVHTTQDVLTSFARAGLFLVPPARHTGCNMEGMTDDVFISYSSEDRDFASQLAEDLEARGFTVWWDRDIPAGKRFDKVIGDALHGARCVVVLWSEAAGQSRWVRDEAADAVNRGALVPAMIDGTPPPLGFRSIQAVDLQDWHPGDDSEEYAVFLEAVSRCVRGEPGQGQAGREAPGKRKGRRQRFGPKWLRLPSPRSIRRAAAAIAVFVIVVLVVSSYDWGQGCKARQSGEPVAAPLSGESNPLVLPIHFDECHEFMTNVVAWAQGTISEGSPGRVSGTFTLKSFRLEQGIKAFVLIQLLDERGNVLHEVKSRTWVDGWLSFSRKERTEHYGEEISEETLRRVSSHRIKFVKEQ